MDPSFDVLGNMLERILAPLFEQQQQQATHGNVQHQKGGVVSENADTSGRLLSRTADQW